MRSLKKEWLSKKARESGSAERHPSMKAKHCACKGATSTLRAMRPRHQLFVVNTLGSAPALNVRLPSASRKAGRLVSLLRLSRLS